MDSRKAKRCPWPGDDPDMLRYHDEEWGVPVHDDRKHFEFLVLDANQAGLSWSTVLHKREAFRTAYARYDYAKIARWGAADVARLLRDPGIIRNLQKVKSAVTNAKALLAVQCEFGTFDAYIWRFVGGKTLVNRWKDQHQLPASSKESLAMSVDMKKRGFSFCGTTICYAYMQAAGLVDDHLVSCFRKRELAKLR